MSFPNILSTWRFTVCIFPGGEEVDYSIEGKGCVEMRSSLSPCAVSEYILDTLSLACSAVDI